MKVQQSGKSLNVVGFQGLGCTGSKVGNLGYVGFMRFWVYRVRSSFRFRGCAYVGI